MSRVLDTLVADTALADWHDLAKAPAQAECTLYPKKSSTTPLRGRFQPPGEQHAEAKARLCRGR